MAERSTELLCVAKDVVVGGPRVVLARQVPPSAHDLGPIHVDQIIGHVQIVGSQLIEELLLAQPVPPLVQVVDVRVAGHPVGLARIGESFHPKLDCCGSTRSRSYGLVSRNPLEARQGLDPHVPGRNHDLEFTRRMEVVDLAGRAHPVKRVRRHVATSVRCQDLDAGRHCCAVGSENPSA